MTLCPRSNAKKFDVPASIGDKADEKQRTAQVSHCGNAAVAHLF